jgi:hypothetical protein
VTRASERGLRFFAGGSAGTLVPIARDRLEVACEDTDPGLPRGEVRFARDDAGAVTGYEFRQGETLLVARRMRDRGSASEPIAFRSGAIELAGLFLRPRVGPRCPAIVFIAGTGYSTADRLYEMVLAERLLEKGCAVLLFDKRGCGSFRRRARARAGPGGVLPVSGREPRPE